MVPDPYKCLGLSHDATLSQIKIAYRKLAKEYHPDRLARENASEKEQTEAASKFSAVSAAYQLLSDEKRKSDYDHIYKYGGYDEEPAPKTPPRADPLKTSMGGSKRVRSTGIGYSVSDPVAYMFSGGQKQSKTVAGIQIPSRAHLVHPPPGGGLRFAFSSAECTADKTGSKKFVSKTTQFVQGKRYTRVETTTLHPDGRKEVVIEGNDYVERKVSTTPRTKRKKKSNKDVTHSEEDPLPWYVGMWKGIKTKLTACHNPCGTILAQ